MGLEIVAENTILGAGFYVAQNFNINLYGNGARTWHSFHNSYMQQAVESGIVGLGIYIFLFFFAMKLGWQLYQKSDDGFEKGLGFGLIGSALACMAGNVAGSYWNFLNVMGYYWIILAMVIMSFVYLEEDGNSFSAICENG